LIDAAEFNNPTSDFQFGMQDVSKHYHLGSFHQSQEMFEIPVNRKVRTTVYHLHIKQF
jgi:TRAP-type mannitol/chloroaromatic compound transport system substrate-binding protein